MSFPWMSSFAAALVACLLSGSALSWGDYYPEPPPYDFGGPGAYMQQPPPPDFFEPMPFPDYYSDTPDRYPGAPRFDNYHQPQVGAPPASRHDACRQAMLSGAPQEFVDFVCSQQYIQQQRRGSFGDDTRYGLRNERPLPDPGLPTQWQQRRENYTDFTEGLRVEPEQQPATGFGDRNRDTGGIPPYAGPFSCLGPFGTFYPECNQFRSTTPGDGPASSAAGRPDYSR